MKSLGVLKEIYDCQKKYIKLNAIPIKKELHLRSFESKFGGTPYIPLGNEYPKHKVSNEPLHLLAQINFGDMPELDPFPKNGLLQFFISPEDIFNISDEIDGNNGEFYIQYISANGKYENPTDLSSLRIDNKFFPMAMPHRLNGTISKMPPTPEYIQMKDMFRDYKKNYDIENNEVDIMDCYYELIKYYDKHHIGGYPSACQELPNFSYEHDDYIVLLQIGHTEYVCFGDCGIATFYIREKDLKDLNFENVKFYWDCY